MLIFVEQRHIDAAQRRRTAGIPWGCRCPIARATCEQLGLPLGSVYAGPISTYVNWNGDQPDTIGFTVPDNESKWFTTDRAGGFMARVDNDYDPQHIEPCTVELSQRPLHCPVNVTPNGFTAVSDKGPCER